LRVEQSVER
jgi:hypothetical protein